MIDRARIEPGLVALVEDATGLDCVHSDGSEPFVDPVKGAIAKYQIFAVTPIGVQDEIRYVELAPGEEPTDFVQRIAGVRELTFRLVVEAYDATPGRAADQAIEAWRDSLLFDETSEALGELGLGFLRSEAQNYAPVTRDHRMRPWASIDVRFSVVGMAEGKRTISTIDTLGAVTSTIT